MAAPETCNLLMRRTLKCVEIAAASGQDRECIWDQWTPWLSEPAARPRNPLRVCDRGLRGAGLCANESGDSKVLPKVIPDKLPGTVHEQYIRCGKPNCRCAQGKLHGPYYYRFWRDRGGRLHKEYVHKADVEVVRAACEARRDEDRAALAILEKASEAVSWLLVGEVKEADDPIDEIRVQMDLLRTVDGLARLACGEFGSVRHSIRAAEQILPCFSRWLTSQA